MPCLWSVFTFRNEIRIAFDQPSGPVSGNHRSFNLAPKAALGNAITAIAKVQKDLHFPASLQADFQGTPRPFAIPFQMPLLILAALVTVYIVLGFFTKVSSIRLLFFLPSSAGVGAFLALIFLDWTSA